MAIPGDHRSIEKASAAPWLPGWEPRAGRLARARLTRQADVAEIERFRPEDLLPGATIFDCLEAATALNPEKSAMVALTSHDLAASPRVLSYTDLLASLTRTANLFHQLSEGAAPSVGIVLPMVPAGLIAAFAAATCGTRDADQSLSGTAPYRGVTAGLASRHPLDDGRCDLDQARRHQGRGSELASCVVPRCLRHYQGFREVLRGAIAPAAWISRRRPTAETSSCTCRRAGRRGAEARQAHAYGLADCGVVGRCADGPDGGWRGRPRHAEFPHWRHMRARPAHPPLWPELC